ncbi:hypothetical protein E3226_009745 [Legionella geestiana]|uniref:hypothetical protein n=1 Tax=Legionella geestiana TaxID=45065 RepID=UPI001092198F|nr:hypothetical protein [Legionella geestiana]QDQ40655.1 hypothetical protein E3226_009745 [Legionella geestiana]
MRCLLIESLQKRFAFLQNAITQALMLISGLLVNLFIPLVYGLTAYGEFLKTNLLVFIFHKFTDVLGEPLISQVERPLLFSVSFALGLLILSAFALLHLVYPVGSVALLAAMLFSNCVLLVLYANLMRTAVSLYLLMFTTLFFVLPPLFKPFADDIVNLLIAINLIPASLFALTLLFSGKIHPQTPNIAPEVVKMLRTLPGLFALTLVNNLFTNILPWYLSFFLPAAELGLFRVQVSVVQAAGFLFPVHTRVIAEMLVKARDTHADASGLLSLSLHYFFLAAFGACIAACWLPFIKPFTPVLVILPLYHACLIYERFLLAKQETRALRRINLAIALFSMLVITRVHSLSGMMLLYATGLALYLLMLHHAQPAMPANRLVRTVALGTPLMLLLAYFSWPLELLTLATALVFLWVCMPVSRQTLSLLGR